MDITVFQGAIISVFDGNSITEVSDLKVFDCHVVVTIASDPGPRNIAHISIPLETGRTIPDNRITIAINCHIIRCYEQSMRVILPRVLRSTVYIASERATPIHPVTTREEPATAICCQTSTIDEYALNTVCTILPFDA